MTQSTLIENAFSVISKPPAEKAEGIFDFAGFILKKHEESLLQEGLTQIVSESEAFAFLDRRGRFVYQRRFEGLLSIEFFEKPVKIYRSFCN